MDALEKEGAGPQSALFLSPLLFLGQKKLRKPNIEIGTTFFISTDKFAMEDDLLDS